jgi:hypothetical protein
MWIHQRSGFKGIKSRNAISGLGFRVWKLALLTTSETRCMWMHQVGPAAGRRLRPGASAARSEARVHQTLRAGRGSEAWEPGSTGVSSDRETA